MKALVGLGNPGPEYGATRHNVGFLVAEAFAARRGVTRFRPQPSLDAASVARGEGHVLVVKPRTYMNRSGQAVRALVAEHGVLGHDLVVAHDDLDLELGSVRVKVGGGHGGHNGLRSILAENEGLEFVRLRLGIRRPDRSLDAAEWVLAPFLGDELPLARAMVDRGADAVERIFEVGPEKTMNEYNRRGASSEEPFPASAG